MSSSPPSCSLYPSNSTTPPQPAPSPPSKNQETLGCPVINRQILQPAPPSKRAAPTGADSTSTKQIDGEDQFHSFLPRELAEIFITRQRQEGARRIRLLVCTSFISGIESTEASFHDDDEKEMAKTIQANLRNEVSEFAASETIPSLSKEHSTSHTGKALGNLNSHLPSKPATTTVSSKIPKGLAESTIQSIKNLLPKNTTATENSWATVVQNGHKKSRTTLEPKPQTTPASQISKNSGQTCKGQDVNWYSQNTLSYVQEDLEVKN